MFRIPGLVLLLLSSVATFAQNVTFQVDMSTTTVLGPIYITGAEIDGWSGSGAIMTDPDSDLIYEYTATLSPGLHKFRFLNGGWAGAEDMSTATGQFCSVADDSEYNRFVQVGSSDVTLPVVCFNECALCNDPDPANVDVTFRVDMNATTVAGPIYVTGNDIDNWCGNCNPMSDGDGDGIYEATLSVPTGSTEFKFTNNGWADGEEFSPGMHCTVTNFGFTNRIVYVQPGSDPIVLPAHPFNGCADYVGNMQLRVDASAETVATDGIFIEYITNGEPAATVAMTEGNASVWSQLVQVTEGETLQYRFVNGQGGTTETVPASCADGNDYRTYIMGSQNTTAPVVCFGSCTGCDFEWALVWSDEFDGNSVDPDCWNFEVGTGNNGWGNNELQYYTLGDNADVANGELVITAREEQVIFSQYSSTRMTTQNKKHYRYGKVEARIKLPFGQGIWPAFWMMPQDNVFGGWPSSGEIDIMELLGHIPNQTHGTLHYGPDPGSGHQYSGTEYTLSSGDFSDDYHVFSIEWSENEVSWFIDDVQFNTLTAQDVAPYNWPFNEEFFIILNMAVGGNWPGNPDASTQFPQTMHIDYVRWYQKAPLTVEPSALAPSDLTLYPNPATATAALELAPGSTYTITDINGRVVQTGQSSASIETIDVASWAHGIYFVKAVSGSQTSVAKLVVQ